MAYGIIGAGQETKRQALSGLDEAARLEQRNNMARDAREQAKIAQRSQMVGMVGGVAADKAVGYGMEKYAAKKAAEKAALKGGMSSVAAPVSQTTAALGSAVPGSSVAASGQAGALLNAAVPGAQAAAGGGLAAPGVTAGMSAAAAPGVAAGTAAGTAATGAAATGAATGAAATGAAAGGAAAGGAAAGGASASAGVLGAMGPAGWMALAGLLAFSIFD